MKRFILLIALVGTSAGAETRSITQIAFSGPGIITASEGRSPALVGSGNKIYGYIRFYESNCLPGNISGTINLGNFSTGNNLCDNVWTVADRFKSIDVFSQFTSAFLTFDNGDLIGVRFDGTYGPNRFRIDTNNFTGIWSYYPPYDYSYRGTWELTDVRIAYDGEALPGTVPEPASWAMLVAGFGIVGAALRWQRPPPRGRTGALAIRFLWSPRVEPTSISADLGWEAPNTFQTPARPISIVGITATTPTFRPDMCRRAI